MNINKTLRIPFFIGCLCIFLSFILILVLGIPTIKGQALSFKSTYKDRAVTLSGTYYDVSNSEYAVLICPGYSCDRQKWRPVADLIASNGCSVMLFDYAGQGASSSTIGFDNAKNDSISKEIDDAIEELHKLSGIDYNHIILLGHSMGGRAILRLLYDYNNKNAVTTVTKKDIHNVILFSPEVNYHFNAQASLFAGTSDADEEPWKSYDLNNITGTNVYLYGSTADDIVKDEDVLAIFEHLGGKNVPESGTWEAAQINDNGSSLTIGVTGGVLHSYQMYSPKFAKYINQALSGITGKASTYPARRMSFVYISWCASLIGLCLLLYSLNPMGKSFAKAPSSQNSEDALQITSIKRFLLTKLLMWLPGLLAAFLICCLCVVLPFGSPVMNIPYMCCISGYGLIMFLLYKKEKLPGTCGKLPKITLKLTSSKKTTFTAFGIALLLLAFVWFILHGTMYRLIPLNYRLFWVVFATVLMFIGYYISGCEKDALAAGKFSSGYLILYNLIQYVALFLLVLFYLVLKSYSGVIGQAQNMLFMYMFSIPLGDYIRVKTGNRFIGALVSAFVFQTFMITSAALIAIF